MSELARHDAVGLAELIRNGALSPVELVDGTIERVVENERSSWRETRAPVGAERGQGISSTPGGHNAASPAQKCPVGIGNVGSSLRTRTRGERSRAHVIADSRDNPYGSCSMNPASASSEHSSQWPSTRLVGPPAVSPSSTTKNTVPRRVPVGRFMPRA